MPNTPINPQKIQNIGVYGVVRQAEVDDNLTPDGAVVEAINTHFDRKGAVTLRPGIVRLGNVIQSGNPCLGLYNAMFSNSGSNALLVVFSNGTNNYISRYTSSSWYVTLASDANNNKTRFVTFADRVIRVQGGTGSIKCWQGATASWDTTGNPINPDNAPPGKFIERYKGRIYIIGDASNPDRLYFSEVITSAGNITWANSVNFRDIEPSDGENATGLRRFSLELLIFKPNYLYRFKSSGLDPHPLIRIGTRSNESIIEGKRGLYFHHDTGFYLYNGGIPQEISRPLSDIIEAIPLSFRTEINSWKDSDHIYWSVGDLTIAGESWVNVVCRYTESSQIWTIYSYGTEFRFGAEYNDGTTITQVGGDSVGSVHTINSGTDDNATPVSYRFITKWYKWGNILEKKIIQQLSAICEKAQGSEILYQIDEDPAWKNLGQIRKYITNYEPLTIGFHRIRFKVQGMSKSEAFVFLGIEIPKMFSEGIIIT